MDRLTSVCFQAGTCRAPSDPFVRWTYDGVGNRLTEQRPSGTASSTYDAADELTQAGSTAYTYDQNGNALSAGSRTFTYDLANRLKTTTLGNTTTTYSYDVDGKRLQAATGTQAAKKTNFLWDVNQGLPQLALERDGNNSLVRRYSYGARRISQTAGSNTSYYLHDGLGSVANLTSSSGATQWTWSYEPYGAIRTEQKASGNQPDNFLKFTGEYVDPTGLYHLRARQYDAVSGRFLTRDPVSAELGQGSGSLYAYVVNRPTLFVDPTGRIRNPIDNLCWLCHEAEDVVRGAADLGEDIGESFFNGVATNPNAALILGGGAAVCVLTAGTGCAFLAVAAAGIGIASSLRENVFTECKNYEAFVTDAALIGLTGGIEFGIKPLVRRAVRKKVLTQRQGDVFRRGGPSALFAAEQVGRNAKDTQSPTC